MQHLILPTHTMCHIYLHTSVSHASNVSQQAAHLIFTDSKMKSPGEPNRSAILRVGEDSPSYSWQSPATQTVLQNPFALISPRLFFLCATPARYGSSKARGMTQGAGLCYEVELHVRVGKRDFSGRQLPVRRAPTMPSIQTTDLFHSIQGHDETA
jgi:hypothetical protein